MAAQAIWSGTISFSLVAIPVKLVTAVRPGRVSFHLLHARDYARLSRRMFCSEEETEVSRDEIVRGYEIGPDRHVVMTDEELESVSPERSRTIEITEFIDLKDLDPVYYDHPYHLVPSQGGEKAYRLLTEILERTNKAGLAKLVLGEREHLVALFSRQGALALTTLHYSAEVLPDQDFTPGSTEVAAEDERRVREIVKSMTRDFNPGKYADERQKKIRDVLVTKARGQDVVESPAAAEETEEGPPDLVAALEESMRSVNAR